MAKRKHHDGSEVEVEETSTKGAITTEEHEERFKAASVPAGKGAVDPGPEPAPYHPIRDSQGRLTRAGMEEVIKNGGSVMFRGRNISTAQDLPYDEQIVAGDDAAENQVLRQIDDTIRSLETRKNSILESRTVRDKDKHTGAGGSESSGER